MTPEDTGSSPFDLAVILSGLRAVQSLVIQALAKVGVVLPSPPPMPLMSMELPLGVAERWSTMGGLSQGEVRWDETASHWGSLLAHKVRDALAFGAAWDHLPGMAWITGHPTAAAESENVPATGMDENRSPPAHVHSPTAGPASTVTSDLHQHPHQNEHQFHADAFWALVGLAAGTILVRDVLFK